jgi:hypothetical protein
LVAIPFTEETMLSRARRLAPTGTRTARSASCWAASTRVLGWVDVLVDAVVLGRAVDRLRVEGLRALDVGPAGLLP